MSQSQQRPKKAAAPPCFADRFTLFHRPVPQIRQGRLPLLDHFILREQSADTEIEFANPMSEIEIMQSPTV
jgi:hypothetical protein